MTMFNENDKKHCLDLRSLVHSIFYFLFSILFEGLSYISV